MSDLHRTVSANGYSFAYVEAGGGSPLVFLHGSLMDYRYWTNEVAYFAQGFRVIAPSRRHHWPTPPIGSFRYEAADQTDDMIAFIEALKLGAVHLVGHSYGGYIAARIACLRPDLLSSLILIEPGGPIEGQDPGRSRIEDHMHGADLVRQGQAEAGVSYFLDTVCFEPKWEDGSEDYKAMTLTNALTITEQVKEIRPTLLADDLSRVSVPTLLMIGARSVSPFPETIARIKELVLHAHYASVPDASHLINVDNEAAFRETLAGFLDGV